MGQALVVWQPAPAPRSLMLDGMVWFPVLDLAASLRTPKGGLYSKAVIWLRANLSEGALRTLDVIGRKGRRGGKLLCVKSTDAKIVATYATHLERGKDFRAKWCDLPSKPDYDSRAIRLEVSWRNIYDWSYTDHAANGVDRNRVGHMRDLYIGFENLFGHRPEASLVDVEAAYNRKVGLPIEFDYYSKTY